MPEPQSQPPNDPPQSPAPPAPPTPPAEPPKPSFRAIDDDLAEFGAQPPPETPPAEPPPDPEAPPAEPPPETPPDPSKPTEEPEEDYLGIPKPKPKEEPKPSEEPPPTGPLKAPELRAEYKRVKERLAEVEKELGSYKSGGKPVDEGEKKVYVEEIDRLKKQLEEAHGHLRTVAYEQSQEYKEKYEKPFVDAWQEGAQQVASFNVTDHEGNTRKGTPEDFAAIMQIADNEQAANIAQEMFGSNAFYVLAQRRDIIKLHTARSRVLEEFRANLGERQKAEVEQIKKHREQQEQHRIQANALWKKYNADTAERYPDLFKPADGDEEGNNLLQKGFREADLAFSGAPDLPEEKRIRLHSAIRNRAAAFGRLVHRLKTKDDEISALKAELDEIRGSTPGPGQEGREKNEKRRPTADEEIEAAAMRSAR